LLNALDGVATPHGLLTFMTTNNLDTLDDALIRRGRIDKRLELKPPVRYQVEQMFNYVYSEPLGVEPKQFNSMADLSDVFKRFTTDAESARMEIKKA
jgi:ATP-dependent 26S proteasome regulatory subunit